MVCFFIKFYHKYYKNHKQSQNFCPPSKWYVFTDEKDSKFTGVSSENQDLKGD